MKENSGGITMKMVIVIFCLLFLCGPYSSGAVCAEEGSQATLEETLEWIKSKVDGEIQLPSIAYINTMSCDSCNIQIVTSHYFVNGNNKREHFRTVTSYLNLKDISEAHSVSNDQVRNGFTQPNTRWIMLRSRNKYKKIKITASDDNKDNLTDGASFDVRADDNLTERIVKAFNHAANLCGGGPANQKKEPF